MEPNWTRPGQAVPATAAPAPAAHSDVDDWFLTAQERGNPHTELDSRHADGAAWSTGNLVRPLVHGATYFSELLAAIRLMGAGDQLMLTDWRGDRDELLEGPGTEVGHVLADAARRTGHPRWAVDLYERCLVGLAGSADRRLRDAATEGLALARRDLG